MGLWCGVWALRSFKLQFLLPGFMGKPSNSSLLLVSELTHTVNRYVSGYNALRLTGASKPPPSAAGLFLGHPLSLKYQSLKGKPHHRWWP